MPVGWHGRLLVRAARRGSRLLVLAAAVTLAVAGCTTETLSPTTSSSSSVSSSAADATGDASSDPGPTAVTTSSSATQATPTEDSTSTGTTSTEPPTSEPATDPATAVITAAPLTYSPPADAEPVAGDCPYLPQAQVQADTGQRMGDTRIRPATPQPVCEFTRSDGKFLATVRVLQLDSDAAAVSAVDFYIPRDASNPESRPAGWAGGSQATDDGSRYGVSKGGYAVIAETNQKQSVYARLLAVHAIENLGL